MDNEITIKVCKELNIKELELLNIVAKKVQIKLYKDDKLYINRKTILNIMYTMKSNNIDYINVNSVYLNCIIDSLQSLVKFNQKFTTCKTQ